MKKMKIYELKSRTRGLDWIFTYFCRWHSIPFYEKTDPHTYTIQRIDSL